ncbi:hypothetical protein [Paenibacillus glacialis]|uniref:Uncharacterized protein n=1 Tax=Paenibacillus glacialis TaxID=494026 RepID=A0A168DF54_9BACL|nr:hypothetical protein [Paenibacillus glacialis]OAB34140.1 hypothetical protein PGLA_24915 [Paenibacillus glacialis]
MIRQGDILELKGGRAYKVLLGHTDSLIEGNLLVVELDEDNNKIGEPFDFEINASTPIIDIIR